MGYRHSREDILAAAMQTALGDGLSRLTFGRVAKRLGVSDRVIVYYFPRKQALIAAVLSTLAEQLQGALAQAFTDSAADHLTLARAAWPVLATTEFDPIFGLYFEASGLAAAGIEPFNGLAGQMMDGWVDWLSGFFNGTTSQRRAESEATLALLDGLLLLRQLGGAAAANRAAGKLGVR